MASNQEVPQAQQELNVQQVHLLFPPAIRDIFDENPNSSPNSSDSPKIDCYCVTAPPTTTEEELRIKNAREKFTNYNAMSPHVEDAKKYKRLSKIGEGSYGEVFQAKLRTDEKCVVAMKKINKPRITNSAAIASLREVKILMSLSHRNIVNLIEVVQEIDDTENKICNPAFYMVFEFCDHDLSGLIADRSIQFSLGEIKEIMRQLFTGVKYLHSNMILHRDIKSANILITKYGVLKIADFGLARVYSEPTDENTLNTYTNPVVTIWYRPPELLLGEHNYGTAVDMWSLGCVMAELWKRDSILKGSTDQNQLFLITQLCGSITPEVWPKVESLRLYRNMDMFGEYPRKIFQTLFPFVRNFYACDLLDQLLALDPEQRISADAALCHDFFWRHPHPSSLTRLMSSINANNFEYLVGRYLSDTDDANVSDNESP